MTTYQDRDEAVYREVIAPLETDPDIEMNADESVEEQIRRMYDVDAIAAKVIGDYDQGFASIVDQETFWEIVRDHTRPEEEWRR